MAACLLTDCVDYYVASTTCTGGSTTLTDPAQVKCLCADKVMTAYKKCYPCLSTQPEGATLPSFEQMQQLCITAGAGGTGGVTMPTFSYTGRLPTPTRSPGSGNSGDDDSGSNVGLYVGIGAGVLALVLIVVAVVVVRRRRKNKKGKTAAAAAASAAAHPPAPPMTYAQQQQQPLPPPPPPQQQQQQQHQFVQPQPQPPAPPVQTPYSQHQSVYGQPSPYGYPQQPVYSQPPVQQQQQQQQQQHYEASHVSAAPPPPVHHHQQQHYEAPHVTSAAPPGPPAFYPVAPSYPTQYSQPPNPSPNMGYLDPVSGSVASPSNTEAGSYTTGTIGGGIASVAMAQTPTTPEAGVVSAPMSPMPMPGQSHTAYHDASTVHQQQQQQQQQQHQLQYVPVSAPVGQETKPVTAHGPQLVLESEPLPHKAPSNPQYIG